MNIQRIGSDDWQRLKVLRLAALKDAPLAFESTYEAEEKLTKEDWTRQIETLAIFMAVADGIDFGMVCGIRSKTETRTVFLVSLWVAPTGRGLGAGKKLMLALINWARQSGFTRIELDVADDNAPAIALYEQCNFIPTGETGSLSPPRCYVKEHRRALML